MVPGCSIRWQRLKIVIFHIAIWVAHLLLFTIAIVGSHYMNSWGGLHINVHILHGLVIVNFTKDVVCFSKSYNSKKNIWFVYIDLRIVQSSEKKNYDPSITSHFQVCRRLILSADCQRRVLLLTLGRNKTMVCRQNIRGLSKTLDSRWWLFNSRKNEQFFLECSGTSSTYDLVLITQRPPLFESQKKKIYKKRQKRSTIFLRFFR